MCLGGVDTATYQVTHMQSKMLASHKHTSMTGRARTALAALTVVAAAALSLLTFAPLASADLDICAAGTAAGKCEGPQGLAVDNETGRLYVADRGNNRIDVFEADGTFVIAFGWGVDTGASKLETCTTESKCNAGIAGSGPGQFDQPTWIAVDNDASSSSHHAVYVGTDNFRVQKFKATGEFIKAFGTKGSGPCQFSNAIDPIAVGPGGDLYVADHFDDDGAGPLRIFTNRVERFDSEGNCLGEVDLFKGGAAFLTRFAVDSAGSFYVTTEAGGGLLRKYDSSGALLYELGSDTAEEARGIGVDGADNVFVKQRGAQLTINRITNFITEYDSTGAIVKRFGYAIGVDNLAFPSLAVHHSAGGDLFASPTKVGLPGEVKYLSFPPPGPIIMPEACKVKTGTLGNTKATLVAEVNPEGKATTTRFQYVDRKSFEAEGGFASKETKETAAEAIGSDFEMHEASAVASLVPETEYRCRVLATNADAPGGVKGEEGAFTTLAPLEIGDTWASKVGTEEATLTAEVNPLEIPTTGYFEYVDAATFQKDVEELGPEHGFDHATKAPEADDPIEFGAGKSFKIGAATVNGLKPGTAYRYRIVATDPYFPDGFDGPTKAFRTFAAGEGGLPDSRRYELVSPGQKNSAEVAVPGWAGGINIYNASRIQAAAPSGEAITYTSFTSFGEAESAPGTSEYLSRRTAGGWQTENLSPLASRAAPFPPFTGFSPDLDFGAFFVMEPALTPDCQKDFQNLYLRDNRSGAISCLSPEGLQCPGGTSCADFDYAGASVDGTRAFLAAASSCIGEFGYDLYEWSAAGGLQAVSVLPGQSEAALPTKETAFGAKGAHCQVGLKIMRNVVSEDGSRAFWTYELPGKASATQLLVRVDGTETVQLDAVQSGKGKAGNGVFWAASTDGSVAYFTTTNRLVSGSLAEAGKPDLYRYDLGAEEPLTDLTKGSAPADVLGVVGASDDGSYVYFVAKGVLSEEANAAGDKAELGRANLYVDHEGETSFIGILSSSEPMDAVVWSNQPRSLAARVSPDGRHLAFLSIEAQALAGYDNTIAEGQHCQLNQFSGGNLELVGGPLCPQAFLYDAGTEELSCGSCNPTGARPLGPAVLPGWTNAQEGPRYLSDHGQRLFFESLDKVLPADQNDKRDVYEFELPGAGSCTSQSPSFDSASGGCHFLISTGTDTDESFLIDASADGRDAFFSTRSQLVGWDTNQNFDVYDARIGGGFPEPSAEPACEAEACKPPPTAPPLVPSAATPGIQSSGNPVPPPKKKKHHRKKHKAKKKHARAGHEQGARR